MRYKKKSEAVVPRFYILTGTGIILHSFVHIVEHILHVLILFKLLQKFLNLGSLFLIEGFGVVRYAFKFGSVDLKTVLSR